MKRLRLMIADDHTLLAEALRKLLEPTCEVVGIIGDGLALLNAAATLKPDVVVADIGMPLLNGLEAGRKLKQLMPKIKLIFLTIYEDPDLAREAMRSGASGYVLKTCAASELLRAIELATIGMTYITPKIEREMYEASVPAEDRSNCLTLRQRQVTQLLAEGKSTREASNILNVSTRTIQFHKYKAMQYLGIKTTTELIRFAIERGSLVAYSHASNGRSARSQVQSPDKSDYRTSTVLVPARMRFGPAIFSAR
jgi:DNA-binding NarL/FixJ family response regulator